MTDDRLSADRCYHDYMGWYNPLTATPLESAVYELCRTALATAKPKQEPPSEPEPGDDETPYEQVLGALGFHPDSPLDAMLLHIETLRSEARCSADLNAKLAEARDRLAAVREAAAEVAATGYLVNSAPPEWFEAIKKLRAALVALVAAEKRIAEREGK